MSKLKKVAFISKECVACGSCLKACRLNAISIYKGIYATINADKCVGCGKCANVCPASIISIVSRGGGKTSEEALV